MSISRRGCVFYDIRKIMNFSFFWFLYIQIQSFELLQLGTLRYLKLHKHQTWHKSSRTTATNYKLRQRRPAPGLVRCVRIPAEHLQKYISQHIRPYACKNSKTDQHTVRQFYTETVRMFQFWVKSDPQEGTQYEAGLYACPCQYFEYTYSQIQHNCWLGLDCIKQWYYFRAVLY